MNGPFKAGDQAPVSGIYRVTHYQHRMPHHVSVREGTTLPRCIKCGEHVGYELVPERQRDGDLSSDIDFQESE